MYYRRKVILALLEIFGGELNKIAFQKLLLIMSKLQKESSFEFVPYKYGCFSFQSYADIGTMIKYDQISEVHSDQEGSSSIWQKKDDDEYLKMLKKDDLKILIYLKNRFSDSSTDELIRYTYKKYPFYAINSSIANRLLTPEELLDVDKYRPNNNLRALYTIGYEGISQERYFNKLIKNNIKVLCDVRKNPFSMKFGFSKNQLKNVCEKLGIQYIHFPDFGIESSKRKELKNQCDYEMLFDEYKLDLNKEKSIKSIVFVKGLLEENERIALTCFEANIHQCHRKHLAEKISKEDQKIQIIHL